MLGSFPERRDMTENIPATPRADAQVGSKSPQEQMLRSKVKRHSEVNGSLHVPTQQTLLNDQVS
jgi:hypothetical protein